MLQSHSRGWPQDFLGIYCIVVRVRSDMFQIGMTKQTKISLNNCDSENEAMMITLVY